MPLPGILCIFFFKQKTAYEMDGLLEFRRVLFRSLKAAAKAKIPAFIGVADNVPGNRTGDRGLLAGFRRRRLLRHVRGVVAASGSAASLVRGDRDSVYVTVIPHLGVKAPTHPEHHDHEGMALGFIGRLVHRKGLDTLLEALTRHRE